MKKQRNSGFNQFMRLLKTEFKRIFSNNVLVVVFFGAPLLYGIMFAHVYKQGKLTDMPVAVIDKDQTALSAKIIEAINDNEALNVTKVQFDETGIAREMPTKEYVAVVVIPENFEADVLQKRYPEIMADVNTANLVTANFASKGLQTVLGTISAGIEIEALKKAGMDPQTAAQRFEPFKVNYNRFYNSSGNYLNLLYPGILATVMQQIILLGLGLAFARDFEDGYFLKLVRVSKSSFYHIMLKIIPFIPLITFVWMIIASFYVIYDIEMQVFTPAMVLLCTVFSLACISIGLLCSLAIPNQLRATEILMVIAMPSFLLSGFTWPLSGMPPLIQEIAKMLPLTHFLDGFRKLVVYGGTFSDIVVPFRALCITAIVCFIGIVVLHQIKIRRTQKKLSAVKTA
ncbi:MAG: ABC transporter permease [Niabella sp.]